MNYKDYSLEKLEEWLHDCLSNSEATPQEIYNVIKKVVQEKYYYHKDSASKTYELLALLNGKEENYHSYDYYSNSVKNINIGLSSNVNDVISSSSEGKVIKWVLPVQQKIEEGIDDYYVQFPDDLLEAANLKKGDLVDWIDNGDGTFTLCKVTASVV